MRGFETPSRRPSVVAAMVAAVATVATSGCATGPPELPAPVDEYAALPAGAGRDLVIRACSSCHAPTVSARQRLDLAGWKSVVDQMAGLGTVATNAELEEIVRYLAAAFPASRSPAP